MTDVLDDRIAGEPTRPPPVVTQAVERAATGPDASPASRPERWLLAALLAGAALIHAAMVPSHLGEAAVEGAGFVAAAWAQILLAVAVQLRPTRRVLVAVVVSSVALIAGWAVSRTAGLPFGAHAGHPESVSIVDGACVALEVAALLLAGALALGILGSGVPGRGLALVGAVGAVALATTAIASPSARDHAAGSHGDHGGAEAGGHDHGATEDDLGFSLLSNGHQHDRGVEPLTTDETVALAGQLAATAELVRLYPTIAAAEAAGWRRAGPFSPGLGTHYMAPTFHLNADGAMNTPEDLMSRCWSSTASAPTRPSRGSCTCRTAPKASPRGSPARTITGTTTRACASWSGPMERSTHRSAPTSQASPRRCAPTRAAPSCR
jgi:hypothetical protein